MTQRRGSKPRKHAGTPKPSKDVVEGLPPRRGGGKPWTTPRQSKFLEARVEAFEDARRTTKKVGLKSFWRLTIQDFLKEWPLDANLNKTERDDKVEAITERIKAWYNNHCRSTVVKSGDKTIINFSNKTKRRRSHVHTYSVHFGDLKIVPILTERWEKHEKYPGPGSPVPLWFRNELTKEIFDDETDEMKEEVARLREEDLKDFDDDEGEYQYLLDEEGIDEEEFERRRRIIELQQNISALPNTIVSILEQVREQTGFMGVCAFFGSEPKAGGNITAYTSSVGETAAGTTIEEYIEGFEKDFEDKVIEFGRVVITESERAELCMPGMEGKKNYGPGRRSGSNSRVGSEGPSTKKRVEGSSLRKKATLNAAASRTSGVSSRQMGQDSDSEENDPASVNTLVDVDNDSSHGADDDDGDTHGGDIADEDKERQDEDMPTEDDNGNIDEATETCQQLLDILASTDEEVPEWLSSAITYLYQPNDLWVDTLQAFVKFEEALGFPCAKKGSMYRLSSSFRPGALSQFINNHRKKEPTINDPEAFADEVYLWWISLQPPSRRNDESTSILDGRSLACLASHAEDAEVWEDLRKGSINGVFGILCCISWWLRMDGPLASDDLLDLIQDVVWVLEVMTGVPEKAIIAARKRKAEEALSAARKRRAEEDEEEEVSPRKKARPQPSRSQPPRSQPPRSQPRRTEKSRSQPPRSR